LEHIDVDNECKHANFYLINDKLHLKEGGNEVDFQNSMEKRDDLMILPRAATMK